MAGFGFYKGEKKKQKKSQDKKIAEKTYQPAVFSAPKIMPKGKNKI